MSQNTTVDHGWALIEYHRGAKANLGLSMFLRPPSEIWRGFELGVIGDNGKMIVGNVDQEIMILYGGESKEEKKEIKNPYQGKWHSGMREEHGAFFHSIETGKKPFADAQIAFDALKICTAMEESIQKQKIITL